MAEPIEGTWHHARTACDGEPCPFHAPSAHPMVDAPMQLRETGLIERTCPHGVGHPDPDSAGWLNRNGPPGCRGAWGVHGCDGCCRNSDQDQVSTGRVDPVGSGVDAGPATPPL